MSDFGGVHRYNVTGLVHDMWGFPSTEPRVVHDLLRHLVDKLENRTNELARYQEFFLEDAETVLIAYGSSARSARHVVEDRRQRASAWTSGIADAVALSARHRAHQMRQRQVAGGGGDEHGQVMQSVKLAVEHPSGCFWPTASTAFSSPPRTSSISCESFKAKGSDDGSQGFSEERFFPHLWCRDAGTARCWAGWCGPLKTWACPRTRL